MELTLQFLDKFLPLREPSFEVSDPAECLGLPANASLNDSFAHLERTSSAKYSFYFSNSMELSPYHAIVSFNSDGSLVLGLSGDESEYEDLVLLRRLEAFAGTSGFRGVEEHPPGSRVEFFDRANGFG